MLDTTESKLTGNGMNGITAYVDTAAQRHRLNNDNHDIDSFITAAWSLPFVFSKHFAAFLDHYMAHKT